ncbi:hypothetical protein BT93_L3569 [Corymbia citriodora subsp. variegata]|uniref:Flavonol synthase n=1 Tax=Corymbia citriodora subsp. variegata TaxID=360336 RepID=A0A8T0CI59_CORYI|nr:hypothetical protein BT93_L3569 [Corymbia citriodora subsp. variegata]
MNSGIPTVDLSPFFAQGDEEGKRNAIKIIGHACSEYGFFQVVNHGVPVELMKRALALSKKFFNRLTEEKLKSGPVPGMPIPGGYTRQPERSADKNEYFMMFPPGSSFKVYPINPPGFRDILDEMFSQFVNTGRIIENIINECLGLPSNLLTEYNDDRMWDLMTAYRYFPATKTENTGVAEHKDDEVGGLEVQKEGNWIPVTPVEGMLVVNVRDVIQVLSNDRFKSVSHRVVRQARDRYSYAFFYNIGGDKWVEPLPQFTKEIKEAPKYKGFLFKEYLQLRSRNKTNPPSRPEGVISIKHYSIPAQ